MSCCGSCCPGFSRWYCGPKYYWNQAIYWPNAFVLEWLKLLGLEQYNGRFRENGVDGETLLKLKRSQFALFEIEDPQHVKSLHLGLKALRSRQQTDYSTWMWSCELIQVWLRERGLEIICQRFADAAVHGHCIFVYSRSDFDRILNPGITPQFSPLVLRSLVLSVQRAKKWKSTQLFPEDSILDWGPKKIREWLHDLDLVHLVGKFRRHGINGTSLLTLTINDLQNIMGLTTVQSSVLLRQIRKLKARSYRIIKASNSKEERKSATVEYATPVPEQIAVYKTEEQVEIVVAEPLPSAPIMPDPVPSGYYPTASTH